MLFSNTSIIKLNDYFNATTADDLPASIILGAAGGLCGAFYIFINHTINYSYRKKVLKTPIHKIIEA